MLILTGCGPTQSVNPFALRKENAQLKSALRQYQDQLAQSKIRADNLDADNEQLHNELALQQDATRRLQEQQDRFARAPRPPAAPEADYGDEKEYTPPRGKTASNRDRSIAIARRPAEGDSQVFYGSDGTRIRVANTALFDPGKATLKPGATKVLDEVAASLRSEHRGELIGIEGHTDSDPIKKSKWKDNHELSYQRARAVYDYLTARAGISPTQLYIAAFGPNAPVASNGSSSGKSQNRRVEFVVRPGDGAGLR
jgi:flagellar motor protein MotB